MHNLKAGIDLDHIGFDEAITRAPVSYLREDGTVLRQSVFPANASFSRHNAEIGAYSQDRWTPHAGLLLDLACVSTGTRSFAGRSYRRAWLLSTCPQEPRAGQRYPRHRALLRTHATGVPDASAGGIRYDTYFAADGVTRRDRRRRQYFPPATERSARLGPSTGAREWKKGFPALSMFERIFSGRLCPVNSPT